MNSGPQKITALDIENRLINFSVRVMKMAETMPNGVAPNIWHHRLFGQRPRLP